MSENLPSLLRFPRLLRLTKQSQLCVNQEQLFSLLFDKQIKSPISCEDSGEELKDFVWSLRSYTDNVVWCQLALDIECSYYGMNAGLLLVEKLLKSDSDDFYQSLDVGTRFSLVGELALNFQPHYSAILKKHRHAAWLLDLERFYVLSKVILGETPLGALDYFQQHRASLILGLQQQDWVDRDEFLTALADQAKAEQRLELCQDLLSRCCNKLVSSTPPPHKEADYCREIQKKSQPARLDFLRQILSEPPFNDAIAISQQNAAINNVLRNADSYFIPNAFIFKALGDFFSKNKNSLMVYPHRFALLHRYSLELLPGPIDQGLWQGFLELDSCSDPEVEYLRCLAHIHSFLSQIHQNDALKLFQAKKIRSSINPWSRDHSPFVCLSWERLHFWIGGEIEKQAHILPEEDLSKLRLTWRLANDDPLELRDIEIFCEFECNNSTSELLEYLRDICRRHDLFILEDQVNSRLLQTISGLRNSDLELSWDISKNAKNYDLSWRIARVQAMRQVLPEDRKSSWEKYCKSLGEVDLLYIAPEMVDCCMVLLAPAEEKFIRAYLNLAAKVLFLMGDCIRWYRRPRLSQQQVKIHRILGESNFFGLGKEHESVGAKAPTLTTSLAAYCRGLPELWPVLFKTLVHELGVNAWNGNLNDLKERLPPGVNGILPPDGPRHPVNAWLRSLSSSQLRDFEDLQAALKCLSQTGADFALARFFCRLSTAIYPQYGEAIEVLQNFSHLPLLRDLEKWLLSPSYSELRTHLGLQ